MYVLMGANGNIASRAARMLLEQRKAVRVIGRTATALAPLQQRGAELAVGDARDSSFLARAFEGASAVYVMIPTDYAAPDLRAAQAQIGTAIATALASVRVRRVVNLSSLGAELSAGTGPIVGLHEQEQRLDALADLDLLHLRPAYFMENHFHAVTTIEALGAYVSAESSDVSVPMVATPDIASTVVRELIEARSRGVLHLHAPRHYTFQRVASVLGAAIRRPDLTHVQSDAAAARAAMLAAGFSPDAAEQMLELAGWLSAGTSTTVPGRVEVTATTLEAFAPRFREAYEARRRAAA